MKSLNKQSTSQIALAVVNVLILASTSMGLASDVDGNMQGQPATYSKHPYDPDPLQVQAQPGTSNLPSNDQPGSTREDRVNHPQNTTAQATSDQSTSAHPIRDFFHRLFSGTPNIAVGSPGRVVVPGLHKNGNCLELNKNEDFYPLFNAADSEIQATTYPDPKLQSTDPALQLITLNLNGGSPTALRNARREGITMADWPIALHGPFKMCGSVDMQLQIDSPNLKSIERIELGPGVVIQGYQNVSIVSSQLMNIEITGNCPARTKPNDFTSQTPCIRFQYDLRTTQNTRLYIQHDGPNICRVDQLNMNNVEARLLGNSKDKPLPCNYISRVSTPIDYTQPTLPPQAPPMIVYSSTTQTNVAPVIARPALSCNGPYVALIRPTIVDINFGLSPAPVAPVVVLGPPAGVVYPPLNEGVVLPPVKVNPKTQQPIAIDPKTQQPIVATPPQAIDPKTQQPIAQPDPIDPKTQKVLKAKKHAQKKVAPKGEPKTDVQLQSEERQKQIQQENADAEAAKIKAAAAQATAAPVVQQAHVAGH